MIKEIVGRLKLRIKGGGANPAPPVGPVLGAKGINIMEFCKQFNEKTKNDAGKLLPVVIVYYVDKSFDFVVKNQPVVVQLLEVIKLKSGSAEPNRKKIAEIDLDQVKNIAENKFADLNCFSIESAMKMVIGTAKSMGVTIKQNKVLNEN